MATTQAVSFTKLVTTDTSANSLVVGGATASATTGTGGIQAGPVVCTTLTASGMISGATTITIGPAGAGSVSPAEFVSSTDSGLALTSTSTAAAGGVETYVAGFLKNSAASIQKVGAIAFQWTDKDVTSGYASANLHATAATAGVTTDYFGLVFWAKHGMTIFPTDLTTTPGDHQLRVNGELRVMGDGSTQSLYADSSFNVAVGTITAAPVGATVGKFFNASDNYSLSSSVTSTSDINHVLFYNGNGLVGHIRTNGSATTYSTSSDARLKRDHGPQEDLSILRGLRVRDAEMLSDGARYPMLMAQEAVTVAPFAVTRGDDTTDAQGHLMNPWTMDKTTLIPLLIAGWQSHAAEIADLHAQLDALRENT